MKSLLRLIPYVLRYKGAYAGGLIVVVVGSAAQMVSPLLIKKAIEELEKGVARDFILYASLALAVFAVFRGLLIFAGRTILLTVSRNVEFDLRNDIFQHLEKLPASYYDRNRSGDLTSRVINDLEGLRMLTGIGIMALSNTGLTFLFSMIGMIYLDWKLALISLVPLSMVTIVTAVTGPLMHRKSLAVQDKLAGLSSKSQENFSGARVVKAFVQEDHEIGRFDQECRDYRAMNMSLARVRGASFAGMTLCMEAAIIVTLFFGGKGIIQGTFTIPELAAFTTFQFMLVWPMIAIGWVISLAQRGAACMARISEVLDHPLPPDGTDPQPAAPFSGRIEFRNLTFAYEADREPALKDVSFTIEPGWRVAILGRTGSGKSTLGTLLLRLYDPPPGTVFVDGVDIRRIPSARLRSQVGPVPSEIFLFSDTLRANIAFGAIGDAVPAEVDAAAHMSRIAQDAVRFPNKLDQVIGERGVTLSGGQKQRTALARALIRRPSILLLDDALSSVDAHTEREILGELRTFMKGRTSLIMTHRMAAVRDVDLAVVLDGGRVAEIGRPDDLIRTGGIFAKMVERQRLVEELES